jgi:hypothetical protein
MINAHNSRVILVESGESDGAEERLVLSTSNPERGVQYLSEYYLNREDNSYKVSWMYTVDTTLVTDDYDTLSGIDIPSYNAVRSTFFQKRFETFPEIYSIGSYQNSDNVFTKWTGETYFNNKSNSTVVCRTNIIKGDTFSYDNGLFETSSEPFYKVQSIIFSDNFEFGGKTPVSNFYAEETYAYSSISNVTKFIVRVAPFSDRNDKEIISIDNILERMSLLYDIDEDMLYDSFKVKVSSGREAITFKSLLEILIGFLNTFYVEKMKMFLSNYDDFSPIADMISYISDEIENLKSNYIRSDECSIPIANIDEGCAIPCNGIHLEEPHLMVTKQKLKSIVRCALMCDTIPYTEDELASVIAAPILDSNNGINIPQTP